METHAIDMAFHLSTHQCPLLLAFPTHERMASIAQNPHTHAHFSAFNGGVFTKMARVV
ncbi:MAG: hypothetical protein RL331_507 [Bacteroidota bacterium]